MALLRGINLGARNKIAMADLRDLFAGLGAERTTTHVQSGNVVFAGTSTRAIEARIKRDLGLDIAVLVRSAAELDRLVARNLLGMSEPKQFHDVRLEAACRTGRRARLRAAASRTQLSVAGPTVYLIARRATGWPKLSNDYFEKTPSATTRNWNTVTKLAELARA